MRIIVSNFMTIGNISLIATAPVYTASICTNCQRCYSGVITARMKALGIGKYLVLMYILTKTVVLTT